MAFFLTCGTHTFNSLLQGYEVSQPPLMDDPCMTLEA